MEDPPTLQGGEDPEENLIGKELADLLWERFQSLPEHQRLALTLVLEEGLSYEETARVLKVTLAQVKSWVFRGRTALRRVLESYEVEGKKEPRKKEEG
jgi:RNA polymerase sigma-70 factor (ECF subfamily)